MRQIVAVLVLCAPAYAKKMMFQATAGSGGVFHGPGTAIYAVEGTRLQPMRDVVAKLECVTTSSPKESNHWRNACESALTVLAADKVVARLSAGVAGIDFAAVGGNSASLSLSLVEVNENKESFIAVADRSREGDEVSRESENTTLYVVDGKTLRPVFWWKSLEAYDPGPDGSDEERQHLVRDVIAEKGALTLVSGQDVTPLVWDGKRLVEAPSLVDCPSASRIDCPSASRIDGEPLIVRVLNGERLQAAELKAIAKDGLDRLRNAPYARHGRHFKNPSLQSYFYRDGKLKPNPAVAESQLDAADLANLALIVAEIKSR